MRRWISTQI